MRGGGKTRKEKSMVRTLAESLQSSESVQHESDKQFILDSIQCQDKDLVPYIANLLRNGGIRRAVTALSSHEMLAVKGRELSPSVQHFRKTLGIELMWEMLNCWEPAVFSDELWTAAEWSRDDLIKKICFALNVKEGERLPSLSPELRYTKVLVEYCGVRYIQMGRRFRNWKLGDSWGYFGKVPNSTTVRLLVLPAGGNEETPEPEVAIATMGSGDDWTIKHNHSLMDAIVESVEEDSVVNLAGRFKKQGHALPPPPTLEWNIDPKDWPEAMRNTFSAADTESEATPAKKRPRGSGLAWARGSVDGANCNGQVSE